MTKSTPPLMPGLPLVGNMLDFMRDRDALFRHGHETLGKVFAIRVGPRYMAVLGGDEAADTFFSQTDKALRMDKAYGALRAMFGEIAFTASPETYNAQRHILHAPFKGGKMPGYLRIMQQEIQAWLDSLGDSGEMELVSELAPLVQNVAAHAIMGQDFRQRMGRQFWDLYEDLNQGLDMVFPPDWPLPKFRRRDRAKAEMRAILRPILDERRQNAEQYDDMLQDFINATYKDGRPVEDEIITGLITALMFAGHETTVGQAAWTIVELLRHREYRQVIQEEIARVLPAGTLIDQGKLGELEQVTFAVHETTRTHPSADMIARYVEEDIDIGEFRVPAGWMVILSANITQRLPENFECPHQYDPARFGPGREEDKAHRYAITGFGGGVHKCTGMNFANAEMTLITALFFQQMEAELLTTEPRVSYSIGAGRPDRVMVQYRRKPQQVSGH